MTFEEKTEIVISQLRADRDRLQNIIKQMRAEIEEVYNDRPRSYNHAQRTELFCKVIEIIDKYKIESEEK